MGKPQKQQHTGGDAGSVAPAGSADALPAWLKSTGAAAMPWLHLAEMLDCRCVAS